MANYYPESSMTFWLHIWRDAERAVSGYRAALDEPRDECVPDEEWNEYISRCRRELAMLEKEAARAQARAIGWASRDADAT